MQNKSQTLIFWASSKGVHRTPKSVFSIFNMMMYRKNLQIVCVNSFYYCYMTYLLWDTISIINHNIRFTSVRVIVSKYFIFNKNIKISSAIFYRKRFSIKIEEIVHSNFSRYFRLLASEIEWIKWRNEVYEFFSDNPSVI